MPPSKLDLTQHIARQFNAAADVELEKRVAKYQLTPQEQQERFDLQKTCTARIAKENEAFNNPEEFQKRVDTKYAELADKHNKAQPELKPGNNPPMNRASLYQQADQAVRVEHAQTKAGYVADYVNGMNKILDRAAEDGRGPQAESSPQREQLRDNSNERDRDRD